eukprot:gnl/MRDRNA2_/MRDRNA2_82166_c0_seq1.p1 gnl/MRDRNA2_/MRDRNA2_82166_c0~~gnl/MRDRNA2_/MRDRNA2_82166_c0_seq1.p1  ORF type:complete len:443 (+),score=14.95 gnl/MRDRNA2_/MRDRNA2_82166_c0_seq1:66-1394(+)
MANFYLTWSSAFLNLWWSCCTMCTNVITAEDNKIYSKLLRLILCSGLNYASVIYVGGLVINHVLNGDLSKATAESQAIFSGAYFLSRAMLTLSAGILGQLACKFGTKKVISFGFGSYVFFAVTLMLSLIGNTILFIFLGFVAVGMFTPLGEFYNSYLADALSDRQVYLLTQHKTAATIFGGAFIALLTVALCSFGGEAFLLTVVPMLSSLAGLGFSFQLPDVSPPKAERSFQCLHVHPCPPVQLFSKGTSVKGLWLQLCCWQVIWGCIVASFTNFCLEIIGLSVQELAVLTALQLPVIIFYLTTIPPVLGQYQAYRYMTWPPLLLAALPYLIIDKLFFMLMTILFVPIIYVGQNATFAFYMSHSSGGDRDAFISGNKFTQGLPFSFGVLVGGLALAVVLATSLREDFPGVSSFPSIMAMLTGWGMHVYFERVAPAVYTENDL